MTHVPIDSPPPVPPVTPSQRTSPDADHSLGVCHAPDAPCTPGSPNAPGTGELPDGPESQPATRVRWRVFGLAFATSGILYWHRYLFGFVKPTLAEQWNLTNTELGRLDSAFSLTYTLFQFPFGIAADVAGVHCVLSGLTVLWCAGLALLAVAPSSGWIWMAQATVGAGQSAVYACLSRVARVWYPPRIRTTLQGLVGVLAGRLGALSSSLVFSSLLLGWLGLSWRTSVGLLAAIGFAHAAVFAALFRDSPRRHPGVNARELAIIEGGDHMENVDTRIAAPACETPAAGAVSRWEAARSWFGRLTWRSLANVVALGVQTILSTFADNIYASWLPLFLWKTHGLKFKEMGFYSALPLLGGAVAGLVGGQLNDRLIARTGDRRRTRAGVAIVGKSLAAVLLGVALCFYDRPYLFCGLLFFVKFFGDWSLTSTLGLITDIGGRSTASLFAFNNTVAGIGLVAAPLVFGHLADSWGWRPVFFSVAITYACCAASWFALDCTIPLFRDPANAAPPAPPR